MKTNNISFRQVGDYNVPNLILPSEEANVRLGKWGMLHKDYMLKHKKVTVAIMTAEGRFWKYLAGIDKQATEMFDLLVEQMKVKEGVTEQLKEKNQLEWVRCMQNIETRARKIIEIDLIYR